MVRKNPPTNPCTGKGDSGCIPAKTTKIAKILKEEKFPCGVAELRQIAKKLAEDGIWTWDRLEFVDMQSLKCYENLDDKCKAKLQAMIETATQHAERAGWRELQTNHAIKPAENVAAAETAILILKGMHTGCHSKAPRNYPSKQ